MFTFVRKLLGNAPPTFHADHWDSETEFSLASLDGRVPGVSIDGEITVNLENGSAMYQITGVDPSRGMLLVKLVEGSLVKPADPVVEVVAPVSLAPTAPVVAPVTESAPTPDPVVATTVPDSTPTAPAAPTT